MTATPWYIRGILYVALPAACVAALYLSIPGEIALAQTAGWSDRYAPAMPVCLSVYALAAGAIATYRRRMELPGQVTALAGSLMALMLAMSAQSISHLIAQDYVGSSALLVVAVSCVPPLTIAHLVHMAETPTAAKTTSQQMQELRGVIDYLSEELTASLAAQTLTLVSRASTVVGELEEARDIAESLVDEAEELAGELEKGLKGSSRKTATTLTREAVQRARQALEAQGETPTVEKVCKTLGVSPATYYRHREAIAA
ncbi:hypothetical protein ABT160_04430 [Streptomyces sp. NPDC001941]|uniref:hypothetical protein n=1 Tax=Streptomyces sp. NPDC001941 TaxID=3154659 RepID=UPI003325008C